jgi:hypothetical protein
MGTKAFCEHCNKVFDTFGKNVRYCSKDCLNNAKRKARGTETHKHCRECGELFDLQGQGGYKYCPTCRGETSIKPVKKTVKELIEDCDKKEVKIKPYFLKRGSKSAGTGNANIMTNY